MQQLRPPFRVRPHPADRPEPVVAVPRATHRAAAAARVYDRASSEQNIEWIEAVARRFRAVLQYCVAESREQTSLRTCLTRANVVAPAGSGDIAEFGVPDDEIAKNAHGAVGVKALAAPCEGDADLAAVVRRQGWIGGMRGRCSRWRIGPDGCSFSMGRPSPPERLRSGS
jgi:hypothetical protein